MMAKCRSLIQENQELGMQMSQGHIGQLESELALQKKYNDELKATQTGLWPSSSYCVTVFSSLLSSELSEFVLHTDEEVEAMQATILSLQEQLRVANLQLQHCRIADGLHMNPVEAIPAVKVENSRTANTKHGVQCNLVSQERSFNDGGLGLEPLVVGKVQTVLNENGEAGGRTSGLMLDS
jgi:hypothetical protein